MALKEKVVNEMVKRGFSEENGKRVWDISDSKLWYLTPELAEGFLKLLDFEPFRKNVVEVEINLIKDHTLEIFKNSELESFNIIDLGCGDGLKGETFVKNLPENLVARYCPVDVSKEMLNKSTERVKKIDNRNIEVHDPILSEFEGIGDLIGTLRSSKYSSNIALLFGGTLGNYDVNDLLYNISESMFSGDMLIIGNPIRTGKKYEKLEKYKSKVFDEWFGIIMKEIGFEEHEVEWDARFENDRVEGFYRVKVDKDVQIGDLKVKLKAWDEIVIAAQYKYFEAELKKFCDMYFKRVETFVDPMQEFCLLVCKK
jgi:uncharacterized SAM-dependent methyltransferase